MTSLLSLLGPLGSKMMSISEEKCDYIQKYAENVKKVKEKEVELRTKKDDIEEEVKQGKTMGHVPKKFTETWLNNAQKLLNDKQLKKLKAMDIEESSEGDDKSRCSFGIFHESMFHRYKWSKVAEKIKLDLQEQLKLTPTEITQPLPSHKVQNLIQDYWSHGLKSRENIKADIVDKLLDDGVHVVGLFGSPNMGKSRLAKQIKEDERVQSKFEKRVAMVNVSQNPNMKVIQDEIVKVVDERWKDWESVWLRAFFMHIKLRDSKKKVLIILDNTWGEIKMNTLLSAASEHCKLLVVSSMKGVCESMGAKEDDIRKMGSLDINEARHLFWTHILPDLHHEIEDQETNIIDRVTTGDHLAIADRLLKDYCRGIPLAVVTIAKMLKDQNLSQWKSLVDELDTKRHEFFRSIWTKNFELLDDPPEKKMFFLLTCLFSPGSNISVRELMRYAMGLDLIRCVNYLTDAMNLADDWVRDLISLSFLETDSSKSDAEHVTLPHLVRKEAMLLLPKVNHNFMVEAIHRWQTTEACQEYTAISLMHDCDHSRLDNFESTNLQMLILDESHPDDKISDSFFQGMKNLRVLVLRGMKLIPHIPTSIGELKNLRLLHLEKCRFGATKWDNELTTLVVLSLRESTMEEFPADFIGKCSKLRLLDLSKCNIEKGIPAHVLGSLSELEGLYADKSFKDWANEDQETDTRTGSVSSDGSSGTSENINATASITELNKLSYLNVLEMNVRQPQQFPVQSDKFVTKLDQFYISVGDEMIPSAKRPSRTLQFSSISVSSIVRNTCLLALLKKSEMVMLQRIEMLQQFIHDKNLQQNLVKLPHLNNLNISSCKEMQSFSSKPFKAPKWSYLEVVTCDNLKFFFLEYDQKEEDDYFEFSDLKTMKLIALEKLESVLGETSCSTTSDDPQGQWHQNQAFFNRKIIFPSLKNLHLERCAQIVKLWDVRCTDNQYVHSFKNLKKINIQNCAKLEVLAPLSIALVLDQLKNLTIADCPLLRTVVGVTLEETDDDKLPETIKLFPVLRTITLQNCPKLKMFLSGKQNQHVFELSSLKTLMINECPKMKSFSSETFKAPKLSEVELDKSIRQIEDINSFLQCRVQDQRKPSEGSIEGKSRGEDQEITSQDKCVCVCKIFM